MIELIYFLISPTIFFVGIVIILLYEHGKSIREYRSQIWKLEVRIERLEFEIKHKNKG